MSESNFWKNKKVFITGHTGFKGSWMSIWLNMLGANVKGYSLQPPSEPSLFEEANVSLFLNSEINDIRIFNNLNKSIQEFSPEIIFHMAAQPLVRASYNIPLETYETNVMGTANLLQAAVNSSSVKAIVNITTDKCYENIEVDIGYKETNRMGGSDPYSSSKGCAELVTSAYRESFLKQKNIGIASARAGNVIGGGDWAEDRLIPDILRAFKLIKPVVIRNPKATRPWQHVLEPLSGYLLLAEKLFSDPVRFSEGWNFGPHYDDVKPVDWILDYMTKLWPNSSWQLDSSINPHEANLLKLDISKAESQLNWVPTWNLETSLEKIVQWQHSWDSGADMHTVCLAEIKQFIKDSSKNGRN
jgi:CDP-glucose 4,6-dehydratase